MPAPYANAADFALAFDATALAQLGSDTSLDGAVSDANSILTTALLRASHEVQSYALRAGQYSLVDLDALQTANDWSLKGLVCDIAMGILMARRVGGMPDSLRDRLIRANQTLTDLRSGLLVFGGKGEERADSGKPSLSVISANVRGSLRMVSDSSFFPERRTVQY